MKKQCIALALILVFAFTGISIANIVEHNAQRFFKVGNIEYPLNSDGKISDNSAREILNRVQKAYSLGIDRSIYEDIWMNYDKVYRGELLDETMFILLKMRLTDLFNLLKEPVNDSSMNGGDYKYINSRLLYFRMDKPGYQYDGYANRTFHHIMDCSARVFLAGHYSKEDFIFERYRFTRKYGYGVPEDPSDEEKKSAIIGCNKMIMDEFTEKRQTLLDKAVNIFIKDVNDSIDRFYKLSNPNSYIMEEEWDALLAKIPEKAVVLSVDCGREPGMKIASLLTTKCMSLIRNKAYRAKLKKFANNNGISFDELKPKSENLF